MWRVTEIETTSLIDRVQAIKERTKNLKSLRVRCCDRFCLHKFLLSYLYLHLPPSTPFIQQKRKADGTEEPAPKRSKVDAAAAAAAAEVDLSVAFDLDKLVDWREGGKSAKRK